MLGVQSELENPSSPFYYYRSTQKLAYVFYLMEGDEGFAFPTNDDSEKRFGKMMLLY